MRGLGAVLVLVLWVFLGLDWVLGKRASSSGMEK